ncbi:MAG: hypothetical protein OXG15_07180 [Gammaproteobacteria bacterium]|nr:hypothetical protein [Gammaproteobacteria bacterium]
MFEYDLIGKSGSIGTIRPLLGAETWVFRATPYQYLDMEPDDSEILDFESHAEAKRHIKQCWNASCEEHAGAIEDGLPPGYFKNPDWEPTPPQSFQVEALSDVLQDIGKIIAQKAH